MVITALAIVLYDGGPANLMISVIVPVYKVEPYLCQCIESIINQTYSDLEIILIDDGSPDRCGEICDEYGLRDNRIRVFHTENRGLSAARNFGFQKAKGEYIGFIDSDDWIEPKMFEVLLKRLEETEGDMSVCGLWREFSSSSRESKFEEVVYTGKEALIALLNEKINTHVWNKLYRIELLRNNGFPEGKCFEDMVFMNRVLGQSQRVAVISASLYHHRNRTDSITNTYTANNLIDFADAHLYRYYYFKENQPVLFHKNQELLLKLTVIGISRIWRWWYMCSQKEKKYYSPKIETLKKFNKASFPLFGYSSWPIFLRITAPFMHSSNNEMFGILYWMNQIFRRIRPERANMAR